MKDCIYIMCVVFTIISCQNPNEALKSEISQLKKELEVVKMIEKESVETSRVLVHEVYLDINNDLSDEQSNTLFRELKGLKKIPMIKNFRLGTFKNLGDQRAMSQFELIMTMDFRNEEDYQSYQQHPIHLNLKKALGEYLAGPPVTYDYYTK